jgi:predicted DNA binding CopG/RHH family protein
MNKRTKYTVEPIGPFKVIADFLPSPDQLAFKEDSQKVTIGLSRRSIAFFKEAAAQYGTPYQTMIRRLLDSYAETYRRTAPTTPRTLRR